LYCLHGLLKEFYHPPDGLKASEVRDSMRYGSSDEDDDDENRGLDEQVCVCAACMSVDMLCMNFGGIS